MKKWSSKFKSNRPKLYLKRSSLLFSQLVAKTTQILEENQRHLSTWIDVVSAYKACESKGGQSVEIERDTLSFLKHSLQWRPQVQHWLSSKNVKDDFCGKSVIITEARYFPYSILSGEFHYCHFSTEEIKG